MYSKEDFEIEDVGDLMGFLLILPFVGLVAPFIIAAYKIGLLQDAIGSMDN